MKKNSIAFLLFYILLLFLFSCNPQVDFGEQYKKTVYIVNSNNIIHEQDLFLGKEDNQLALSVYCAGSENIKEELKVTLDIDKEALEAYNERMMIETLQYRKIDLLPETHFSFENPTVTIKASEQYGMLKLPVSAEGLDPDKRYAVPVRITSNSAGYDINEERDFIVLEAILQNGFSGEYSGVFHLLTLEKKYTVQRSLKAISANSVRMPISPVSDEEESFETDYMLLTIDSDSTTVHISPWKNAPITDLGGNSYDKEKKSFDLHYSCITDEGMEITVHETIQNNTVITEEEED